MTPEAPKQGLSKRDLILGFVSADLFTEDALNRMEVLLREEEFPVGVKIVIQGGKGDKMHFLAKGEVEIINRGPFGLGTPQRLAKLRPGAVFGEMALVHDQPRNADVIAITDVRTYSLSRDDWQDIKAFFPPLAARIEEIAEIRQNLNR